MSQQQNPPEVLLSLQQPDFKSFSIREYVLACRQKDIFHNWPFPKKYLQMCQNHGINNALPPFEPHHVAIKSIRGLKCSNGSQQNKDFIDSSIQRVQQNITDEETVLKEDCNLIKTDEHLSKICGEVEEDFHISLSSNRYEHEENDNPLNSDVTSNIIVLGDQTSTDMTGSLLHDRRCNHETINSIKRLRVKRRGHKGKHKKKLVADILSVAKPCTHEDQLKMNGFYCSSSKPHEQRVEEIEEATDVEKSELTEDCLNNTLHTADCEGDINTLGGKRWAVNYSSNSCNMDQEKEENDLPNA